MRKSCAKFVGYPEFWSSLQSNDQFDWT